MAGLNKGSNPFLLTTLKKNMRDLYLDIETYSSVDLTTCGAYKYVESPDFEILLVAYAFGDNPIKIVDLAAGYKLPAEFTEALKDRKCRKHAHNAVFERLAFRSYGLNIPAGQWHCSAVKAAYCGLPLSLGQVSAALQLGGKAKLSSGKALIKYFCVPCKPTISNGGRNRNLPEHNPEKWAAFKAYCARDVEAEREIISRLRKYEIPAFEKKLYAVDQKINDKGIRIDSNLAANAVKLDGLNSARIASKIKELTGVDNPNSATQLKNWLGESLGKEIKTLEKKEIPNLLDEADRKGEKAVREVLRLRQKLSKTSTKKYTAMLNCLCADGRAHGLFQFYGANRTGRWAGRLIQLQNLPKNKLVNLNLARKMLGKGDIDNLDLMFDDIADTLSQLVRTAFVAKQGCTFAVADFSAIEARVIAWLAGETWRLDVFKTHGKIYEASGAAMFNVPVEEVTKESTIRQKAKIAELALGYQGGVGALKQMGGVEMGLSEPEMRDIVKKWRASNTAIVRMWKDLERCAKRAIETRKPVVCDYRGLVFNADSEALSIKLPSGRELFYREPRLQKKKVTRADGDTWETDSITYMGMHQETKAWGRIDTYGGKLAENITQAVARDLLAEALINLDKETFDTVMHVHDEVVVEIADFFAHIQLKRVCEIMCKPSPWSEDLPLDAEGYLTVYYKKD